MTPQSKSYLRKRKQIICIISKMEVVYESEDCYHSHTPDFWSARKAAEEIMKSFGVNKTNELKELETNGYVVG